MPEPDRTDPAPEDIEAPPPSRPREEVAFLRAYESTTAWKPQVVADNVLTGIFLADTTYRGSLAALLLQESVEAARRLAAVWHALADRSMTVARRLEAPLPGAAQWTAMASAVGLTEDPRDVLRMLGLDESAEESATELLEFGGLTWYTDPIRAAEAGPPALTVASGQPATLVWSGHDAAGAPAEAYVLLEDEAVIALADATGDFVTWTRDFLGAYIDARTGANR
ncbi:MAG: hypothetical protein M0R73_04425 [Dehalococcoidia bacterium]|nr:hypothetical protein [Dehalococcoidia bacterium]